MRRRVGGPGWAGIHGSFIGIGKSGGRKATVKLGKSTKAKKKSPTQIDRAAHHEDEDVRKAAKRVLAVQSDIATTTKRLDALKSQYAIALNKLELAESLATPRKQTRRPTKPQAKVEP